MEDDAVRSTLNSIQGRIPSAVARDLASSDIHNLFLVLAHKRSGHHAIIDWILSQYQGTRLHYNFANKRTGGNLVDQCDSCWSSCPNLRSRTTVRALSINLENYAVLSQRDLERLLEECRHTFPRARRLFLVLVVRDAYNNFASCLLRRKDSWRASIWENHARLFLGDLPICSTGFQRVRISFNHWFLSQSGKESIASQLGVDEFVSRQERVPHFGGGSSFDGLMLDGRGSEMKVMERWRNLPATLVRELLIDFEPSLHPLNERIFGSDFVKTIRCALNARIALSPNESALVNQVEP